MKFVVIIIALSLAPLSLAAPSTQHRQIGTRDGAPPGGTSCSSPRPIEYGLDHLIGPIGIDPVLRVGERLKDIKALNGIKAVNGVKALNGVIAGSSS
jgi:hypothetical protein